MNRSQHITNTSNITRTSKLILITIKRNMSMNKETH